MIITKMTTKEMLEGKKNRLFQIEHLLRHCISGLVVFLLSVGADVLITHHLVVKQRQANAAFPSIPILPPTQIPVVWRDSTLTNWMAGNYPLPKAGDKILEGFASDGRVVWKVVNP